MNLTETGMSTSALAPAAQDEIATLFVDAAGYRRHRHPYRPSARRAAASPVAASRTARSPHSIAADNFSFVRELILLGQGVGLLPASLCEADIAAGAVAAVLPSSSPERPDPPLGRVTPWHSFLRPGCALKDRPARYRHAATRLLSLARGGGGRLSNGRHSFT